MKLNAILTQKKAARMAGFFFLFLIFIYMGGQFMAFIINTDFCITFVDLFIQIIFPIVTILLAFTLYLTLKPIHKNLALNAMLWRFGESLTGLVIMILQINDKNNIIEFNVSSILFSVGSFIFFYLFVLSKYIPGMIASFGILASVLIMLVSITNLFFPDYSQTVQFGWIPMFIAEITTGIWLLFKGIPKSKLSPNPLTA